MVKARKFKIFSSKNSVYYDLPSIVILPSCSILITWTNYHSQKVRYLLAWHDIPYLRIYFTLIRERYWRGGGLFGLRLHGRINHFAGSSLQYAATGLVCLILSTFHFQLLPSAIFTCFRDWVQEVANMPSIEFFLCYRRKSTVTPVSRKQITRNERECLDQQVID